MGKDQMPTFTFKGSSTPVINNKEFSARLNGPLKALLGDKHVLTEYPAVMGSEDVHHLLGEQKTFLLTLCLLVWQTQLCLQMQSSKANLCLIFHIVQTTLLT